MYLKAKRKNIFFFFDKTHPTLRILICRDYTHCTFNRVKAILGWFFSIPSFRLMSTKDRKYKIRKIHAHKRLGEEKSFFFQLLHFKIVIH